MSKITHIEQQKRNKDRVSIYLDDEFAFGIHSDLVIKFNLEIGKELEDDFIETILKNEDQKKANNYALNLLSYRAKTEKEIMDKLKEKGYEEEVIQKTMDMLKGYNFINDESYAKIFIKEKSNFNKDGSNKIKMKLLQKGVKRETIEECLEECIDNESEFEKAMILAEKKFSSYRGEDKLKKYKKLNDYLIRKGFSFDIVSKVIREIRNSSETPTTLKGRGF